MGILIFLLALGVAIIGIQMIDFRGIKVPSLISPYSVSPTDWTKEKVLTEINDFRQAKNLGVLVTNSKLNKAAKARLAVITSYEDILGDSTGLSREASLEMVDYSYSWVGDLILLDSIRDIDLISFWENIPNSKQTLEEINLKEVGIAVKQTDKTVTIYVILSTPKTVVATRRLSVVSWGGPELWTAINKRRVELGVNELRQKDELCTIAAIRLNQVLDIGKLDGHSGFESTLSREDLKWISEKYNISEFLISGYDTPQLAVDAWENTLGHKKLLSGGEYVWGCVYAQSRFGVAIAAY